MTDEREKVQTVLLTLKDTKGRDVLEVTIDVGPNGVSFGAQPFGLAAIKTVLANDIGEVKVELMPPPKAKSGV